MWESPIDTIKTNTDWYHKNNLEDFKWYLRDYCDKTFKGQNVRFVMNDSEIRFVNMADLSTIPPAQVQDFLDYTYYVLDHGLLGNKWRNILYDAKTRLFL